MSVKNRGLGKGLEALMGNVPGADQLRKPVGYINKQIAGSAQASDADIMRIPMDLVDANPFQPRINFDQEALEELAASIRSLGLIQPITVRRTDSGRYQIISGERRFRASKMAGLTTIPAYVRTADDENVMEMALIENIQREDLNSMEIALAYQHLLEQYSLTQEQLSDRVGKNRATIANYLRLLKLPAEIQMGVKNRQIEMAHARALVSLGDPKLQVTLYREIVDKGYSVRTVEEMVKSITQGEAVKVGDKKISPKRVKLPAEYNILQQQLTGFFKAKVQLTCSPKGKGKISIPFSNEEDLERIMGLFDAMRK